MNAINRASGPRPSRLRWIGRKLLIGTGISVIAYPAIAIALVFWPSASFERPAPQNQPQAAVANDADAAAVRERMFTVRDGARIAARVHGAEGLPSLLIIHGVASQASDMDAMAALLAKRARLRVIAIDLRGHGRSSGARWQVEHVGQFDDDVSDVVRQIREEAPGKPVVLAGHSMGGGVALRYSLAGNAAPVDGFLLMTPLLGGESPSMKKEDVRAPGAAGSATAAQAPVIFRTPRMIGVIMLHSIGITAFDKLPIMLFNHPDRPAYGFAALASMQPNAPSDYRAALKAISKPLMLIAGTKDEYFEASAFPKIISHNGKGEAILIDGATHKGVLTEAASIDKITNWLTAHSFVSPDPQ